MSTYDLRSLKLPRLTGTALRLMTHAAENPVLRGALLPSLLENGGIPYLRSLSLQEPPTYYPLGAAAGKFKTEPFRPAREGLRSGFPYRTVRDYARAYRAGETTPLEVAEKVLDAVRASEAHSPNLNLFSAVYRDDVLRQARESAARFAAGRPFGLLDGVPLAVKDEVDMIPYPTTVGTRFLGQQPAQADSTVVARLRAAGALLIGKANMHEIGIATNGYNDTFGTVHNPFDPACDTGGSSSGSAAAVAAGIVPAAIGADGGGSIRIPAALCGVVGLKATFGRISEFGAAPLCWSVAHLGPLAASVEDAALIYSVIAGPDAADPNTQAQPPVTLAEWDRRDLKGVTAGIYPEWFDHADPQVVQVNREMVKALESRGLAVREVRIPELNALRVAHAVTILSEMAAAMAPYAGERGKQGLAVRLSLVIAEALTSQDYLQAQRMRSRVMAHFTQAFQEVDLLLTPATALSAQPVPAGGYSAGWSDLSLDTEMMRFVTPANLAGHPAISFPAGYDGRGMPIGMQAMGRHWEEHLLLRTASTAEDLLERRKPAAFFG